MTTQDILNKYYNSEYLSLIDGIDIYNNLPLADLLYVANEIRQKLHPDNIVTWQIDRNVNISNVCFVQCTFCNFCRKANNNDAYVTTT
jgi:cyclic dehypoxanthinyl futalosine synthase